MKLALYIYIINSGYYMPARGYEFYLRVVNSNERSELVRYRVEHEKIKFISIII